MNPSRPTPYGVGLAYRFHVHEEMLQHRDEIDLLEISTEDYIVRERRTASDPDEALLRSALAHFPCVAHGLTLSIGSVEAPSDWYLDATNRFLAETGIEVFSEHLAFHSMDGNDLTMFLAIPFEERAVEWVAAKYAEARRRLGRSFALENVTYSFAAPGSELPEAAFLRRVCEETDCTLLLDVTNLFNNASNHGYDAMAFLDQIPMERVSQMHLAGGHQLPDGRWEDSHSAPVMEPVWPIYEEAVRRSPNLRNVILERDSRLRPFSSVMGDIRQAREIFYRHRPAEAPPLVEPAAPERKPREANPLDPRFAGLRAYQRALMGRITDPGFRDRYRAEGPDAVKDYGLTDPKWLEMLLRCDPRLVHEFEDAWDAFRKEDEQIAREYEEREWSTWAAQLGPGGW